MAPLHLSAGDVIVFPHGDAHIMASSSECRPQQMDAQAILCERPKLLHFGGGGEATRLVCGYMTCDPRLFQPVLGALPRVVTVSLRDTDRAHTGWKPRCSMPWMRQTRPGRALKGCWPNCPN